MRVPEVGEWVEVYFIAGDPNEPVYLGQAGEIRDQTPEAYDGPATKVIYQDPKTGGLLKYDQETGLFEIVSDGVDLAGSTKTMVTYAALNTALQGLVTAINATLAFKKDEAGASGTLTLDMSAAEAGKVRTE